MLQANIAENDVQTENEYIIKNLKRSRNVDDDDESTAPTKNLKTHEIQQVVLSENKSSKRALDTLDESEARKASKANDSFLPSRNPASPENDQCDEDDPILTVNKQRFVLFPIKYKEVWLFFFSNVVLIFCLYHV